MVQIKFSFGYEIEKEPTNYRELLKCADEKTYQNKKMRKSR
jgi:GGDEF domain-containing protein